MKTMMFAVLIALGLAAAAHIPTDHHQASLELKQGFLMHDAQADTVASPAPAVAPVVVAPAAPQTSPSIIATVWNFLWHSPMGAVMWACLYAIGEALAHIPSLAANSFFQLLRMGLKKAEDVNPIDPKQA